MARGGQGPPPAAWRGPRPTLLGALWRVADVDGQLAAEGVHPHHAGGAVGAGQRGELAGVAGDAVESLGNVRRSLQDDVLGGGMDGTRGWHHPMARRAWGDPRAVLGSNVVGQLRPPKLVSPPGAPAAPSIPRAPAGLCRAAMGQGGPRSPSSCRRPGRMWEQRRLWRRQPRSLTRLLPFPCRWGARGGGPQR